MPRPSTDQLQRAIKVSEEIAKLEAELASILGNAGAAPKGKRAYTKSGSSEVSAPSEKKKRKKPVISAEGKERIAAAQRKRWAKVKKEKAKKEAAKQ